MNDLSGLDVLVTSYNKLGSTSNFAPLASELINLGANIFAVDDHSTDGTFEFLNEFSYGKQFKLVRNTENFGSAYSRNRAVRESSSSYLLF